MNKAQVLDILETIEAAYPRFEITEKRAELWAKILETKDYVLSMNKLNQHISEKPFAPTISEIAVEPKPVNSFLEKTKQWEAEVIAERNRKHRS